MSDPERPYQVLARRFRPAAMDEIVGQDHILQSLRSALGSARIPHAFLFSGSRGVGKTTLARILARALNCERGPTAEPCDECQPCRSILEGNNSDVVEIDAATHNGVDDIREMRERVGFASMGSRYKVYILDEVHMLSKGAFNAFLKTLEEPPAKVVFILATTELHKVPETVRSRCQVQMFRRVGDGDITRRLQMIVDAEGVPLAAGILAEIAASCRGGMRDAETTLERVLPVAQELGETFDIQAYRRLVQRVGPERVLEVVTALLGGASAPALHLADEVVQGGGDEREALGEVLDLLRALMLLKVDGEDSGLVRWTGEMREKLQALAESCELSRLDAMIQAGLLGRERIRRLEDRNLILELSLLRMASAGQLAPLQDLLAEVRGGSVMSAPVPSGAAAPSAPLGGGAGDLHAALMRRLREEKPLLARTLEHCRVDGPDAGVVRLTLETDKKLHRDRLAADAVQQMLKAMIRDVAGEAVEVVIGGAPAPAAHSPESDGRRPGKAAPGAAARKVVERFDGQIVDVDDDGDD